MQMLTAGRVPSASDWLLIDVGNTFLKWGRYAAIQERGGNEAPQALTISTNFNNDTPTITSQVHRTAVRCTCDVIVGVSLLKLVLIVRA